MVPRQSFSMKWVIVAVAALALAALACGGGVTPTQAPAVEPPAEQPPADKPPAEQPPAQTGMAELDVTNNSSATVCFLYVSPETKTEWEDVDQRLGSTDTINPGQTRTFQVPAGVYDLLAQDCGSETIVEQYGVKILEGAPMVWTLTDTAGGGQDAPTGEGTSLFVINNSSVEVCYLYVSPTTASDWGDDQLGAGNTIPAGSSWEVFGIAPNQYDLRGEGCDGSTYWEFFGADLTADFEWTLND